MDSLTCLGATTARVKCISRLFVAISTLRYAARFLIFAISLLAC